MSLTVAQPEIELCKTIEYICQKLTERSAVLFLGAGINAGIKNSEGKPFPLGAELAKCIITNLLQEDGSYDLKTCVELARHKLGDKALNQYMQDVFSGYSPGIAHYSLIKLPWDAIYTTNFDIVLETAQESSDTLYPIKAIYSVLKSQASWEESQTPYYKLHGCIDYANDDEGKLILSNNDYSNYEVYKQPLFIRLKNDLHNKTFVFVGYSLQDSNFLSVIEDCKKALGSKGFPLSYAVLKDFSNSEYHYWADKYNVRLIKEDGAIFLNSLSSAWESEQYLLLPLEQRNSKKLLWADETSRYEKIGESFYKIKTQDCVGQSNPRLFFKGKEPTWADVRDKVPPLMEIGWALLSQIIEEIDEQDIKIKTYLLTGAAGTGKTTLLMSLAFMLAESNYPVLFHIPSTPLDIRSVQILKMKDDNNKRVFIFVKRASEYYSHIINFIEDLKRTNHKVTLILEDRKNQWKSMSESFPRKLYAEEFELSRLSGNEINEILKALEKHDCLDKVKYYSQENQIEHFKNLANSNLLVALRELTTGSSFDEIIKDEYEKIPSKISKDAYVYISAVGQFGCSIRYQTLINILGIDWKDIGPKVLNPAEGILVTIEQAGSTRHDWGYIVETRHPTIASIIFDLATSTEDEKFVVIQNILRELDPGSHQDLSLLKNICKEKGLLDTLQSEDKKRSVYNILERKLPNNPYVLQHRAILERDLGNYESSIEFAQRAIKIEPRNESFINTLGFCFLTASTRTTNPIEQESYLTQSKRIFESGIARKPNNVYNYIGLYRVYKQYILKETDTTLKEKLIAETHSLIEEAEDLVNETDMIATLVAEESNFLKTNEQTINFLYKALEFNPENDRLRDGIIRKEIKRGNLKVAMELAKYAANQDASAWRFNRHIAQLMQKLKYPVDAVRQHYEAAIRHNKGNLHLLIEYAAYLFKTSFYEEAKKKFSECRDFNVSAQELNSKREHWKDENGLITFHGKVHRLTGSTGIIKAIPQNFEVMYWRNTDKHILLKEDQKLSFQVYFNAKGANASNITPL